MTQLQMAALSGYQCEFKDVVPDICLCKKCCLVARRLTVTSCCGESFCHDCISESKEQNKPCSECGEEDFSFFDHVKFQRQISNLLAYCSLKKRGCGWCGPLKQLDAHLDPNQDNCQYVDTKCPLNCSMTIPKNKVEQHVSKECVRRNFTCQHCNFKATYEEVVGTHLAKCSYVPLQCPNRCGVTCEREVMEDHMRICRLEEVECEFSDVGCEERPKREDQEEHSRQSTQKHMVLTATATIKTKETMEMAQAELQENVDIKINDKIEDLKKHFQEKISIVETNFKEYVRVLEEKLHVQLQEIQRKNQKIEDLENKLSLIKLKCKFKIESFKKQMQKWKSPVLNIYFQGYRNIIIQLDFSKKFANGERAVEVSFTTPEGLFDEHLKWPVPAEITYSLLNSRGEKLFDGKWAGQLRKPGHNYDIDTQICSEHACPISKLAPKTRDDILYFQVMNMV